MAGIYPQTLGVILAGGLARRMGGVNKALQPVAGRPMLSRVIGRMQPQCAALIINANSDPADYADYGLTVVPDPISGYGGPLVGILASLEHAASHNPSCEWIVSVPADSPFVPADLVMKLHAARLKEDAELAVAASGDQRHHAAALWNVRLAPALRHALEANEVRSIHRFTTNYRQAVAKWPVEPFDPFMNVNTQADVSHADMIAKAQGL